MEILSTEKERTRDQSKKQMVARELRIGNLINYKGSPIPVTMIGEYGIQSATDGRIINAKFSTGDLTGILLTEEWMVKLGGERKTSTPFYEIDLNRNIGQVQINPNNGIVWLRHHRNELYGLNPESIQYVHQLQNLYFALTNTELTLKSK